jgi:hypothetical protein
MMKRWLYSLAGAACLLALGWWILNLVLDRIPGVTEANCWRIREGMTENEVEALLGGPPSWRNTWTGVRGSFKCGLAEQQSTKPQAYAMWKGERLQIHVMYEEGRVTEWALSGRDSPTPNPRDSLRAWIGW